MYVMRLTLVIHNVDRRRSSSALATGTLEVRVTGRDIRIERAGEVSLSSLVFCNLASWDLRAANSMAVAGGAGAVAAAATGKGGRAGDRSDDRGKSVIERSS